MNKIDHIIDRGVEIIFVMILLMTAMSLALIIFHFAVLTYKFFMQGNNVAALAAGLMLSFFAAIGACWWQADRDERY